MFKNLVILPLLIVAVSGRFFNFEENIEYNMSVSFNKKINMNGKTKYEEEILKGTLLVQREENKFYAQFFIVQPLEVSIIDIFDIPTNLYKPFMVATNGSEILSITVPFDWTNLEFLLAHSIFILSVTGGTNLSKRIESGNWKNETGVVQLPSGDLCESEISIIESADIVKVQAETNSARCEPTEFVKKIIKEKNISLDSNNSTNMLYYITYERKNMTPKEVLNKVITRQHTADNYYDTIHYKKITYQGAKEIQTKIQLQDDVKTFNKEQLLDLLVAEIKSL